MKNILFLLPLLIALGIGGYSMTRKSENDGKSAVLYFESFDGGGPVYSFEVEDPDIVSVSSRREYDKPDHEEMTGAGYKVIATVTGIKPGETFINVSADSPIAYEPDQRYSAVVDENLKVTLTRLPDPELSPAHDAVLAMQIGDDIYYGSFTDEPEADAFKKELSSGATEFSLESAEDGFSGNILNALTVNEKVFEAKPGMLALTGEDEILICTKEKELTGVPIAVFEKLPEALPEGGSLSVLIWIEWGE